ncbi:protein KTI12 homolog [Melanaphis sacchari]|uniref:Protein KTI12 homolog n=1 Tax=Melanaphis sacchari TaxID=742174 RepID=A0A2H8TY04_9HEMI|nr:protein KTI12 homolog [Melanaphis sacchari]
MPLILMVGLPSSGKTTRAREIQKYFTEEQHKEVILISDNEIISEMNMDKNVLYLEMKKEKDLRSKLHSDALKSLTKENVVILDSGNFIKGFRYELYCSSKSLSTPKCLVVCDISTEKAWELNENRPEQEKYVRKTFNDLVMRYEEPNHSNRWDSPLINLQLDDTLPAEDIRKAIFEVAAPIPNQSTINAPLNSSSYLYDLDQKTQEVINSIIQLKKQGVEGENIELVNYEGKYLNKLDKSISLVQLAKSRKQFLSYAKSHVSVANDQSNIVNMFIQFLNNTITC